MAHLPLVDHFGFSDVPRVVVVRFGSRLYVLDCPFDDDRDEYVPDYTVRAVPDEAYSGFVDRRLDLEQLLDAGTVVGEVAVGDVVFDDTRRASVDDGIFHHLGLTP